MERLGMATRRLAEWLEEVVDEVKCAMICETPGNPMINNYIKEDIMTDN
jgi:hypothetical protein